MNYSTYDLLCAALDQSVAEVKRILDSGIDVNAFDEPGRETALMVAAGGGNLEVVKLLIEQGANINQKSCEGSTAIMPAVLKGQTDVIRYLVSKKADTNYKTTSGYRFSPLQLACQLGHTDIVRCLIDAGADVNSIAGDGSTPLISAAFKGHTSVVQMLLDSGANKFYRTNGMDASGFAEHFGHTDVKNVLDSHVSKTSSTSGKGCLLALVAPLLGMLVCFALLLSR